VRGTRIISAPSWAAGIDAAAPLPPAVPQPRQPGDGRAHQNREAPNRLFWLHCRRLHPVVSGQRLFALESFAMKIRYPVEGSAKIHSTWHYQQPGKTARLASDKALGREPINSEWSADVRFGAHSGFKSDITALPKSANSRRDKRSRQLRRPYLLHGS
jgi:hypothetical protein